MSSQYDSAESAGSRGNAFAQVNEPGNGEEYDADQEDQNDSALENYDQAEDEVSFLPKEPRKQNLA